MGVMLSAAGSLQWYRDALAASVTFDDLVGEAAETPAAAEGLVFLPYLTGERTPHPDPLARGAFVGLTRRHGRGHLTRAVLEGVAFGLADCYALMRDAIGGDSGATDGPAKRVRITGGGARSALWRQIVASVLGVSVEQVNSTEGAAHGAALLAGVGAGTWPDVGTACRDAISVTGTDEPVPEWREPYARMHAIYRDLYPALGPSFARLGAV
jgi:xylulokinase